MLHFILFIKKNLKYTTQSPQKMLDWRNMKKQESCECRIRNSHYINFAHICRLYILLTLMFKLGYNFMNTNVKAITSILNLL